MKSCRLKLSLLALVIMLSWSPFAFAETNWQQKYDELSKRIDHDEDQPPANETQLEPYLHWMEIQAKDRDDVAAVADEIHRLSFENPNDKEYDNWDKKFYYLLERAEAAGNGTVNQASMRFIYVTGPQEKAGAWENVLWRLKKFARKIYSKANETGFNGYVPKERAKCCLNFAIGDIEANPYGLGIYFDRELIFGTLDDSGYTNIPDRDFEVACEARSEFVLNSEGDPGRPVSWALGNIEKIREECDWWGFSLQRQDATDLMNQYYKDALCKVPPHKEKRGHHYFLKLAEQYNLEKSIEYNKGYYGTLFGKVEVITDGETKPAPGANVIIQDVDDAWTVTADKNGYYEIPDAILHKTCSPFFISATYQGDRVNESYVGPLSAPDSSSRLEKNFLIRSTKEYQWQGKISLLHSEQLDCTEENQPDEFRRIITKKKNNYQKANIDIKAKNIDLTGFGPFLLTEDGMTASGYMNARHDEQRTLDIPGKANYVKEFSKSYGQNVFEIQTSDVLFIQIIKENPVDPTEMSKKLQEAMAKGLSNPDAMDDVMKDLEALTAGADQKQFPVKVYVNLKKSWMDKIHSYKYRETGGSGKKPTVDEEETDITAPIANYVSLVMEGTYTRAENGEDRIVASLEESKQYETGDNKCYPPEAVINSFSFILARKQIK